MASNTATSERLVFANTVEALFVRGLDGLLDAPARAELRALGLDVEQPLLPAYPSLVFRDAVAIAARRVFPGLPPAEAYFKLGESTTRGLDGTLVGKASVALARVIGPLRVLLRMPRMLHAGCNYTTCTVSQVGPGSVELTLAGYALPYAEFQSGALVGSLRICSAREPRSEVLAFDAGAETGTFRASWSP